MSIDFVDVYFHGLDRPHPVRFGRLAAGERRHIMQFEIAGSFLDLKINPSPLLIKRIPGLQAATPEPFNGLHGVFADSLPDSWGEWLMNKAFLNRGLLVDQITAIDRLAFIGPRAMGALSYVPCLEDPDVDTERYLDLADIGREATLQYQGSPAALLDELVRNATPSGGARPKILIGLDESTGQAIAGAEDLPDEYRHWLAKFPTGDTPMEKASGSIEYVFAQMAKASGIRMMPSKLVPGRNGHAYFITQRFDRLSGNRRRHVHTVAGLVNADFRIPNFDYLDLLKLSDLLTKSHVEKVEVFRRMAFNIISGNRDDHSKNFSFMMAPDGAWTHTPAYDLTYNVGVGMPVAGKDSNISLDDLLAVAHEVSVPRDTARRVINEVCDGVSVWRREAKHYDIHADLALTIGTHLERQSKQMRSRAVQAPPRRSRATRRKASASEAS